jgi:thiol-disulfide isomerase/thioredoxin
MKALFSGTKVAIILASSIGVSAIGMAQAATAAPQKPLTIGDSAPAFPVDGFAKGTPILKFEKGKSYVVEFWATWCGPCISSMPHLSDMAEKYKGQIDFISVNSWDYTGRGTPNKETTEAHKTRVNEWISKNDKNMRYNIAFDDANDTIANTWMRAAGRNGIPCAFVVDKDSKIAWIGHPMQMEAVTDALVAGKWDASKFKAQFEEEAAVARAEMAAQTKVRAAVTAKDMAAFDSAVLVGGKAKFNLVSMGLSSAAVADPEFAMELLSKYAGKVEGAMPYSWCGIATTIISKSKSDATKAAALKLSADCANMAPEGMGALTYAYHARALIAAGDKKSALEWATKAEGLLDKHSEKNQLEALKKFVAGVKADAQK